MIRAITQIENGTVHPPGSVFEAGTPEEEAHLLRVGAAVKVADPEAEAAAAAEKSAKAAAAKAAAEKAAEAKAEAAAADKLAEAAAAKDAAKKATAAKAAAEKSKVKAGNPAKETPAAIPDVVKNAGKGKSKK